jgi:hypothetical protein
MSVLDNLVEIVKFRIGLDDEQISVTNVRLALRLALSAFNMVPAITYFTFEDDEENIAQLADVLVTYAAHVLLVRQSLIESGREFVISDGGIKYNPANVSNHLINVSREVWNNWDSQVSNLKQSDSFYEDFIQE